MPATNAPSASDSPASSVSQASPSVISSTLSMNSSGDLRRATRLNQARISFWPKNSTTRQQHHRLERRQRQRPGQIGHRLRQGRNDDQQRHHGQILEQQHAHHLAAVRGVQFPPVGQQFRQDRGGRHRQRTPQADADPPGHPGGTSPRRRRSARQSATPARSRARRRCASWRTGAAARIPGRWRTSGTRRRTRRAGWRPRHPAARPAHAGRPRRRPADSRESAAG